MAKSRTKARRPTRKTAPRVGLAAFFRNLWSKPALLERFSSSPEGRAEVLKKFKLDPAHAKMLEAGCVRDIIRELAGVKAPRTAAKPTRMMVDNSTVINCTDDVDCGHEECQAFATAVRSTQ
jgi:hypothetical protein